MNVDKDGKVKEVKLADFGQSCIVKKEKSWAAANTSRSSHHKAAMFGTRGYQAPEMFVGYKDPDCKVDCWALGVILYNLVCGTMPVDCSSDQKARHQTLNKVIDFGVDAWRLVSPQAVALGKGLLQRDSGRRLSIDKVLDHPWLKELDEQTENSANKL